MTILLPRSRWYLDSTVSMITGQPFWKIGAPALSGAFGVVVGAAIVLWSSTPRNQPIPPVTAGPGESAPRAVPFDYRPSVVELADAGTVPMGTEATSRHAPVSQDAPQLVAVGRARSLSSAELNELRLQTEAQHATLVAEHYRQRRDSAWARSSETLLHDELQRELGDGFPGEVVEIDCRETSCVARFEWPNFEVASSSYTAIAHSDLSLHCYRQVILPLPADNEAAYQAHAHFRCDRSGR